MFSSSKLLLSLGVVLGVGGLGLFGANEASKKTIENVLGEKKILDEEIPDFPITGSYFNPWGKLHEKYSNNSPEVKSTEFKKLSLTKDKVVFMKELKNLCEGIIKSKYSDLFTSNENLLDDVKNFCSLSMKEMITRRELFVFSKSTIGEEEKETFRVNLSQVKHSDWETDPEIVWIRENIKETHVEDSNIQDLFSWCKKNYEKSYVTERTNLLNLIEKYCTK